jgi:hypothetical protein
MTRGPPPKMDTQICPNPKCGKLGYPYPVWSWDGTSKSKIPPRTKYRSIRFKHNDGTRYCNIDKIIKEQAKGPVQIYPEYNRKTQEVTHYHYQPEAFFLPPQQFDRFKALPVVIYKFHTMNRDEPELKTLKKQCLKLNEIEWLLKTNKIKRAYKFIHALYIILKNYSSTMIITYGDSAVKQADRISRSNSLIENITHMTDQYGVLGEIERRKNKTSGRYGSDKNRSPYTGIMFE